MTNIQKDEILQLIESEKVRLGDYVSVAKKCGISETAISQLRSGKYGAKGDDIYRKVGIALGYDFNVSKHWKLAETRNFKIIYNTLILAKERSLFVTIAANAGSGKTATANTFVEQKKTQGVYKLNCREWAGRTFLLKLAQELGADLPKGYVSVDNLLDSIAASIKRIAHQKPLIIIDQANSLRWSAMCMLIHVFNDCEDIVGVVILGTENLENEIKKGLRLNKNGHDEIESRFGRSYIRLAGMTMTDTRKICEVNGITDKALQEEIFKSANPVSYTYESGELKGKTTLVAKDNRRIKRRIESEIINTIYS